MLITGLRSGIPLAVLAAAIVLAAPAAAQYDGPVYVRGEMARLARQAYDYNYRNSNRNGSSNPQKIHSATPRDCGSFEKCPWSKERETSPRFGVC